MVETPTLPYAAAPSAEQNSRVISSRSSAGEAAQLLRELGRERLDERAQPPSPSTYAGGRASPSTRRVRTIASRTTTSEPGSDEAVLGGDPRRLGAPRVQHHDPATSLLDRPRPPREVRRGHQRAVGRHRVGAEDQEVRRAVDVGDRDQQLVTEQLPGDQLGGRLVDGGRAEPVASAQGLHERQRVCRGPERVDVRVAEVDPDRVTPVPVDRLRQPVRHEVERLLPPDLHPVLAMA